MIKIEKETKREDIYKNNLISRLNRIEGQVKGIKGMIERDCYCDDVLTQISAASSALDSVSKVLLENHIRSCVVTKIENGDEQIIDEFIKTVGRVIK